MDVSDIHHVAVIGAGSMGHGIAEVSAMAGYTVTLRDIEEDLVQEGYDNIAWSLDKLAEKDRIDEDPETILDRIDTAVDLEEAVENADLVIEAAPEQMSLKQDLFADLDDFTHDDALLASNTSSLSISEIASATDRPDQVLGLHFFNPPVKMDLVEVIYGDETSDETAETGYAFIESIDKTPIYVRKDVHGFVVNTVLGPFMDEPAWMVSEGEATIKQADAAMVYERGYPMGPFELGDMTGIDIGYHVRKEAGQPIPPIMEERVEAEELGKKTGKGYYDYEEGEGAEYEPEDAEGFDTLRVEARMINEAARLVGEGVATPEAIDTGVRLGTGFPEGICARADSIGLDVVLEKLQELLQETGDDRFEPDDFLVQLVEEGKTGEEAGEGFYDYGESQGLGPFHELNYTLKDGLLEIELDRPERMNAMSPGLSDEIVDLLEGVDTDEVRAVTFEGAGDRAFCAGADIGSFGAMNPTDTMDVSDVFEVVASFPRPVLAKIDGYCLGAGLELALACDLRLATEDSTFGNPEITLGLIPGGGSTQRLLRMIGETRAKELVYRGNHISADRAEDWGIINRSVPGDEFGDTVDEFLDDLVNGPPIALKVAKKVMNHGQNASLDAALAMESQGFGLLFSTEDMKEGTMAFLEDREPDFKGE